MSSMKSWGTGPAALPGPRAVPDPCVYWIEMNHAVARTQMELEINNNQLSHFTNKGVKGSENQNDWPVAESDDRPDALT